MSNTTEIRPPANIPQHFVNVFLGPYLTGLVVQTLMMGFLTIQAFNYFVFFSSDPKLYKILVVALFVTGAIQAGMNCHLLYATFVSGFGIFPSNLGWSFYCEPAWTGFIAVLAQSFLVHRHFTIASSKPIVVIGGLGIGASFGASIATSVSISRTLPAIAEVTTWLAITTFTNLFISAILISISRKDRTPLDAIDPFVYKASRLIFKTAAPTACVAVINLTAWSIFKRSNGVHFAFQFIMGKLYAHTVLVTLLGREYIPENNQTLSTLNINTMIRYSDRPPSSTARATPATPTTISSIRFSKFIGFSSSQHKSTPSEDHELRTIGALPVENDNNDASPANSLHDYDPDAKRPTTAASADD